MRRPPSLSGSTSGASRTIAGLSLLVLLLAGTTIMPWGRVAATANAPVTVRVVRAGIGDLQAGISLNGELRATDQIDVTPRVSSRVIRLPVTVGQVVAAGAVLAELDRTQLEVEVAKAQATLTKEQAALAKLQTPARDEEITKEEANIRAAEAKLSQLEQGARPEDVNKEAAAVRAAEIKLSQAQRGARPEDIDMAVQKLNQAQNTRARAASALGAAKESARIGLEQALAALQGAQAQYGAAKLLYDEAERTGKDPNMAPSTAKDPAVRRSEEARRELTDIKLRSYKADYEAKEAALRSAEATVQSREVAYEDAKQQEIAGLQFASAQVLDAQANLEKVRGPDADAVAKAYADLEAARAALAKVTKAPDADVVAKAQADLAGARAGLAKAQVSTLDAEVQAARANVQSAEAALRLAGANLREAVVVAPFAGIVTQRSASVGSNVSATTTIVQLVSQAIEVRLSADDAQVTLIEPGQHADVRLNGYPGVVFPASVVSISPTASATSRTFTVTLALEAADPRLKPGMLVQADVAAINRPAVLAVPEVAVLTRATESYVFVVADGKARKRTVTVGVRGGGNVEVLSGLQDGDQVIVEGQTTLNDGDQVTIKN